jgi:hypothetical protein
MPPPTVWMTGHPHHYWGTSLHSVRCDHKFYSKLNFRINRPGAEQARLPRLLTTVARWARRLPACRLRVGELLVVVAWTWIASGWNHVSLIWHLWCTCSQANYFNQREQGPSEQAWDISGVYSHNPADRHFVLSERAWVETKIRIRLLLIVLPYLQ